MLAGVTRGAALAWLVVLAAPCVAEPDASGDAPATEPASPDETPDPIAEAAPHAARNDPAQEPAARPAWPPTALPLALLATLDDPRGEADRATIRDADTGVIAHFRTGDSVRDGVTIAGIEPGVVELQRDGEVEYLSITPVPLELDADDVFYPDLVADLGRSMTDGLPMPPGPEYVLKSPDTAWGTPRTIATLREAIRGYARYHGGPLVRVGDISLPGGGPFAPHVSHREGRDVDLGYVLRGRDDDLRFIPVHEGNLDLGRTWALLESLLETGEVAYVFMDYDVQRLLYAHAEATGVPRDRLDDLFQYPRGRRASHGVLRHWKGHRGHFHVRFAR